MTQENTAQGDLVARVARLERQNLFLKAGLAGITIMVGLVTSLSVVRAADPLETLTAKRFVLKDDRGQERAVLGFRCGGSSAIVIHPARRFAGALVVGRPPDVPGEIGEGAFS